MTIRPVFNESCDTLTVLFQGNETVIETDTSGSQGLGMGLEDWLQADLWQIRLAARAPFYPVGVSIAIAPALEPGYLTTIFRGRAGNTGIPAGESHVFRWCPTF